ncbi:MAG: putative lipoprotein transrane [Caulobacter sp.]|nr:putative lipoprotein transrane [Caulobacter sp.]
MAGGRKGLLWGYLAACLLAAVFIAVRLFGGGALDTDIQSLLPAKALKPPIREAMVQAGAAASSRVAMLVSAPTPEQAQAAADDLSKRLKASGIFVDAAVDGEQTARWMFANRNQLRCEPTPAGFDPESAVQASLVQLYSPVAPVSGEMLLRDPFLLTLRLTGCLLPTTGFGAPSADGAILITGRLTGSAFKLDTQASFTEVVEAWTQAHKAEGVKVARAGAAFHAEDGARHAKKDISTVGVASTLGIVLLLLIVFRRFRALPITLLVVGAGYLGSLAAVFAVFQTVHMLTFVFGSAFVGVTADYAIYYLSTGPMTRWQSGAERLKMIFRPVTVCMLTSAMGFGCLALFGVPIFSQMAVFAVGGLLSAWACAFLIVPLFDRTVAEAKAERFAGLWARLEAARGRLSWNAWTLAAFLVVFTAGAAWAITHFSTLDDVRKFQPRSPVLVAEEEAVRKASGIGFSPNFLLSWGPTADAAKAREAAVLAALPTEARGGILAPGRFDPSAAERAATQARIEEALLTPRLPERAVLLGIPVADFKPLDAPGDVKLPGWIASLGGESQHLSYLIAPVPEAAAPAVIAATKGLTDAAYVDPASAYSGAFSSYRRMAGLAVLAAFGAIGLVLLVIYRRLSSLSVLIAPAMGVAGGVIAASALGTPMSFFSLMGAFVVVGTGADYSILRYEAAIGKRSPLAGLPILITALTAILSMGLLSLSSTYPVRAFGIAVAAGLAISYGLSFVAAYFGGRDVREA